MARFYGSLIGRAKTEATRMSHTNIRSHTRGWDVGVRVNGYINEEGEDEFCVLLTGGSNGSASDYAIGTFTRKDLDSLHRIRRFAQEHDEAERKLTSWGL